MNQYTPSVHYENDLRWIRVYNHNAKEWVLVEHPEEVTDDLYAGLTEADREFLGFEFDTPSRNSRDSD